jgi:hypothetical protein
MDQGLEDPGLERELDGIVDQMSDLSVLEPMLAGG